ncbi:MAG TPA: hypothetical protein DEO62_01860 [Lachnospiraceae bacterium]|nr:hypothetical protein [Lachnospiraceae bacterium]HBZ89751.1 hypothetical protein [Lachnospiraceae bacterium]
MGKIPPESINTGIVSIRKDLIMDIDVAFETPVQIILKASEPLKEKLREGRFPSHEDNKKSMCAVIGTGMEKHTISKSGGKYLNISGFEFLVTGILMPVVSEKYDFRVYIYWDCLSDECKDYFISNNFITCQYRSESPVTDEIKNRLLEWMRGFSKEPSEVEYYKRIQYGAVHNGIDETLVATLTSNYKIFVSIGRFIQLFEVVYCIVFSYLWGMRHLYENMIKRVCGFNSIRIFWDTVLMLLVYLLIAGAAAMLISGISYVLKADFITFVNSIKEYFIKDFIIISLIFILLAVVPLVLTERRKPGIFLKSTE